MIIYQLIGGFIQTNGEQVSEATGIPSVVRNVVVHDECNPTLSTVSKTTTMPMPITTSTSTTASTTTGARATTTTTTTATPQRCYANRDLAVCSNKRGVLERHCASIIHTGDENENDQHYPIIHTGAVSSASNVVSLCPALCNRTCADIPQPAPIPTPTPTSVPVGAVVAKNCSGVVDPLFCARLGGAACRNTAIMPSVLFSDVCQAECGLCRAPSTAVKITGAGTTTVTMATLTTATPSVASIEAAPTTSPVRPTRPCFHGFYGIDMEVCATKRALLLPYCTGDLLNSATGVEHTVKVAQICPQLCNRTCTGRNPADIAHANANATDEFPSTTPPRLPEWSRYNCTGIPDPSFCDTSGDVCTARTDVEGVLRSHICPAHCGTCTPAHISPVREATTPGLTSAAAITTRTAPAALVVSTSGATVTPYGATNSPAGSTNATAAAIPPASKDGIMRMSTIMPDDAEGVSSSDDDNASPPRIVTSLPNVSVRCHTSLFEMCFAPTH